MFCAPYTDRWLRPLTFTTLTFPSSRPVDRVGAQAGQDHGDDHDRGGDARRPWPGGSPAGLHSLHGDSRPAGFPATAAAPLGPGGASGSIMSGPGWTGHIGQALTIRWPGREGGQPGRAGGEGGRRRRSGRAGQPGPPIHNGTVAPR